MTSSFPNQVIQRFCDFTVSVDMLCVQCDALLVGDAWHVQELRFCKSCYGNALSMFLQSGEQCCDAERSNASTLAVQGSAYSLADMNWEVGSAATSLPRFDSDSDEDTSADAPSESEDAPLPLLFPITPIPEEDEQEDKSFADVCDIEDQTRYTGARFVTNQFLAVVSNFELLD